MVAERGSAERGRTGARFGRLLRHWRELRGISQQDLAERTGISTRHLSFLETERAGPSEQTLIRLGSSLQLPDQEVQRLLHSAGFAFHWHGATGSELVPFQLTRIGPALAAYDPFPAFVTDRSWKIPTLNRAAHALFSRCVEMNPKLPSDPFDIVATIVDPESLGRIVTNREAVLRHSMAGLFRLEPDPMAPDNTARLYVELSRRSSAGSPDSGEAGQAPDVELPELEPEESGAWQVDLDFDDLGHRFTLELLAIPFGGPCVGYGMQITTPTDPHSEQEARAYFEGLIADATEASAEREQR